MDSIHQASSVGRASDFESKGCGFEFHCGQEIFLFVFCRFRRAPDRSTGPMQMKSSMTSIRVIYMYVHREREKVDFKSREVNCLKECALALTATPPLLLTQRHR